MTDADLRPVEIGPEAVGAEAFAGLSALFIAGLPKFQAANIAVRARAASVLVNVEDEPELCDFYVPAVIRRGDLLIAVSTSGKSPGLARLLRQWIERRLGLEWADHVAKANHARAQWQGDGHAPDVVSRKTAALVAERGWLP